MFFSPVVMADDNVCFHGDKKEKSIHDCINFAKTVKNQINMNLQYIIVYDHQIFFENKLHKIQLC